MVGELWTYPDGSRIVELSAKCLPGQGVDLMAGMIELFESRGHHITGEQHTKTKAALELLRSGAPGPPQTPAGSARPRGRGRKATTLWTSASPVRAAGQGTKR